MGTTLTKQNLQNIQSYKYETNGATYLDGIWDPWWNFVVNCTPKWVAPNLITISGLIVPILAFVYMLYYDCTLGGELPASVLFLSGFAVFWYMTLDAIDGK